MKTPRMSLFLILFIVLTFAGEYILVSSQLEKTILQSITRSAQAANTTITKLFINEVYPRLAPELALSHEKNSDDAALAGEKLERVDRTIRMFMFGTDVLKVKIFNISGMTVYSTDPKQIGEYYGDNPPFVSAVQGRPGSQISHRGTFSALDGEVYDRDLVSSYIPVHNRQGIIVGVTEIYSDRTPVLSDSLQDLEWVGSVLVICMVLNFVLIVVLAWSFWWYVTNSAALGADPTLPS